MSSTSKAQSHPNELAARFAGPEGLAVFEATVRERRSAHFPQCLGDDEIGSLLTPSMLGDLLDSSPGIADSIDIFTGSHLVRLKEILHKSDSDTVKVLRQQLSTGASLRFRNLERQVQTVNALGRALAALYGGATTINAYLTPTGKKGFPPHFDNTDVFVLQLLGSKCWTLFDNYTNRQVLPLRDTSWDPDRYQPDNGGFSLTLQAGDVLYIPRGGMHTAKCQADVSLHLTISLDPRTVYDELRSLLEQWACQTQAARERIANEPAPAADALRQLATEFGHWVGQQGMPLHQPANIEFGTAGRRFHEAVEQLRTFGDGE